MSAALLLVVIYRLGKKEPASLYGIRKRGRWWRFMRSRSPGGSRFSTSSGGSRCPGALWLDDADLAAQPARGRARLALRSGIRAAGLAPVYILAATGLWHMWTAGGALRRQAIEITVIFVALLATVGAFGIWWGGASAPSRPIASGLAPAAAAHRRGVSCRTGGLGAPRRAAFAALGQHRHRHHAGRRAGRPAASTTRATARRRCSNSGRRAGSCGRWRRPSSAIRGTIALLHTVVVAGDRGRPRRSCWRAPRTAAPALSALVAAVTLAAGAGRDRHDAAVLAGRSAAAARRSERAIAA